jgi:pyrroloquinoline quinone (PQQ) biosynthesis protein C
MSVRFDDRAFYCEIVRESFQILLTDQIDVETALSTLNALSPLETRTLQQLRDLNLQTMDVLFQATDRFCNFDEERSPEPQPP